MADIKFDVPQRNELLSFLFRSHRVRFAAEKEEEEEEEEEREAPKGIEEREEVEDAERTSWSR